MNNVESPVIVQHQFTKIICFNITSFMYWNTSMGYHMCSPMSERGRRCWKNPKKERHGFCFKPQKHRITEWVRLEGIPGGHLHQPSAEAGWPRTMSRKLLGDLQGGRQHNLWESCSSLQSFLSHSWPGFCTVFASNSTVCLVLGAANSLDVHSVEVVWR